MFLGRENKNGSCACTLLSQTWAFPRAPWWRILLQCRRCRGRGFHPWVRKFPWKRKWQPTPISYLKIPWTEKPGRLQSMGSQRVKRDWTCTHKYNLCSKVLLQLRTSKLTTFPEDKIHHCYQNWSVYNHVDIILLFPFYVRSLKSK